MKTGILVDYWLRKGGNFQIFIQQIPSLEDDVKNLERGVDILGNVIYHKVRRLITEMPRFHEDDSKQELLGRYVVIIGILLQYGHCYREGRSSFKGEFSLVILSLVEIVKKHKNYNTSYSNIILSTLSEFELSAFKDPRYILESFKLNVYSDAWLFIEVYLTTSHIIGYDKEVYMDILTSHPQTKQALEYMDNGVLSIIRRDNVELNYVIDLTKAI